MTPSSKYVGRILLAILSLLAVWNLHGSAATGTIMPSPYQTVFDTNGNPVNNAKICTYIAGTTTPVATYTDVNLSVANTNPIRADAAGRFVAFLTPGASYKFEYQTASGTIGVCDGAAIKTVDNILAVPLSAANLDITGTAGESLTAGQAVYLSDGSGSKNVGQWYKADNTLSYASVIPQIGMVPSSITSGSTGTIRIGGQMTGLTVTVGSTYYVGTAGGITLSAPVQRRIVGVADSSSTLILTPNPSVPVQNWTNDFRLTLTTAVPVTTTDVTAATTIYASPLTGNRIDLPDSNCNPVRVTSVEFSIAVPATTSTMYDIWAYNNASVATLELLPWTNDTTRATAIARTGGRYFKSGDCTRMYLGSFRTTTVSGQTEDSAAKRYLWNYYNRVQRVVLKGDATTTWNYTTATWRQARADATNQVDVVQGVAESPLWLQLNAAAGNSSGGGAGVHLNIGIGEDSTTTPVAAAVGYMNIQTATTQTNAVATLNKIPAVGRHFYAWLEASEAAGTTAWLGTNNTVGLTTTACGLNGLWWS